jgi:23S rRNA (guanosine2251-2'-O)-methyltransferase
MRVGIHMSMHIYGKNPCKEILTTDKAIIRAFIEKGTNDDVVQSLIRKGIEIKYLIKNEMNTKFTGNHQGIVFEVEDYQMLTIDEAIRKYPSSSLPVFIMLDGITDPHNLGAIIRSAEAGGVKAIILPKNRSVSVNGTVAKVASGALEHMDIVEVTNLTQTIEKLKKLNYWIVGTDMVADKLYTDIDVSSALCVIIGSEGKGVSKLLKSSVDYLVKIPMVGQVNSLNASVSAGIIIFEILKKKGF